MAPQRKLGGRDLLLGMQKHQLSLHFPVNTKCIPYLCLYRVRLPCVLIYHTVYLETPAWRAGGRHTFQGHHCGPVSRTVAGLPSEVHGCCFSCHYRLCHLFCRSN